MAQSSVVPDALQPHYARLGTRMKAVHGIELDPRLYLMIMRWMAEANRAMQTDETSRDADRAQYLKTIDDHRALWAVKLSIAGKEKFIPIVGHRTLRAPIDTLPLKAFERYGRHLHYATNTGQHAFAKTKLSIHKNYDLGQTPFTFSGYMTMCEMCRTGKTEPLKYRVQDATVHRLRLVFGNVIYARTFYVIWNSDLQLIVGTLGRGIAESLKD